ncbi:BlaI family penicillinase repressor [Parabacteroides sp. PFB2-10]|uniref:BlaI/MecI/CopY family transcriptional regulator n=1 Tax=Parabacteroides sp. PFB2-10 TaxID=1742405 RepID=UPI00247449CE|nr:BlaI/MecI/CopY family transcriptional regulator [Parabacteroides sp. PFB2-10]MDH6313279.1 BlaI family penicillinase repressor [Parabacteroides sp. PFB2-10]MDL2245870.1 BlaI/MecI/CopY family transcriptional regulator [Parabacteroides sp. OttesenSCG-928-J18]
MKKLTAKEEEILGYFWEKGPLFIRELLDMQAEPKPHYNTLSTMVRILEEKGYIGYKAYGNTYQYYALVTQEEYRNRSLKTLVNKYFGNSYTSVVSTLIEEEKLSVEELQDIIRQIKDRQ